jgi:PBP1b-binding outer membrane lipoprotein LpoB
MKSIIILISLALLMAGCTNKQIITQTQVEYIKIPQQLLEVEQIQKPIIKTESDIINAYLDLFKNYLLMIDKINAIKELNQGEAIE